MSADCLASTASDHTRASALVNGSHSPKSPTALHSAKWASRSLTHGSNSAAFSAHGSRPGSTLGHTPHGVGTPAGMAIGSSTTPPRPSDCGKVAGRPSLPMTHALQSAHVLAHVR